MAVKKSLDINDPKLEIVDPEMPWLKTLRYKHKEAIENNECLCSDIINIVQSMLNKQYPQINGFQLTNKAPVYNDLSERWCYSSPFSKVSPPSVQIHHTGQSHWVVSVQDNENVIYVLDSLNLRNRVSASMEIQLSAIYGKQTGYFDFIIPRIQKHKYMFIDHEHLSKTIYKRD